MMKRYEKDVLHVIRHSEKPIRMRDIVKMVDEKDGFVFIGQVLTDLYRRGAVSREMIDGHYHYQIADNTAPKDREQAERRKRELIKTIVSTVRHDMADDEIEALAAYLRNRGVLPT
jgi:predicted MarR family transcription regulator